MRFTFKAFLIQKKNHFNFINFVVFINPKKRQALLRYVQRTPLSRTRPQGEGIIMRMHNKAVEVFPAAAVAQLPALQLTSCGACHQLDCFHLLLIN